LSGTGAAEARRTALEALARLLGRQGLKACLGSSEELSPESGANSSLYLLGLIVLVNNNTLGSSSQGSNGFSELIEGLNDGGSSSRLRGEHVDLNGSE